MQFVNLTGSSTGTTISKSNNIIRLENKLEANLDKVHEYYTSKPIRFDNKHTLSTICNCVPQYFGTTPQQTYDNVKHNLRHIANLFNIVYPGVKQAPQSILLGLDYLIHKEVEVDFLDGMLYKWDSPFKLYYHNQTSLRMEDYLQSDGKESMIAIDMPLIASLLHHERLKVEEGYTEFTNNEFITKNLILPLTFDCINLALLNRFELDSLDINYSNEEDHYIGMTYRHDNISALYDKAKSDYRQHFTSLTKTQLSDLYNNLPLLNSSSDYRIGINDYYMDSLMWINAVSEVNLYNKLTSLNDNYNLRLEVSSHENRLKKLLGRRRSENLVRHLDKDSGSFYESILER